MKKVVKPQSRTLKGRLFMVLSRLPLRVLSCVTLSYLIGCTNPAVSNFTSPLGSSVTGHVRGAQQPVSGSAIQLYAVGLTGDGSAAAPLLTQPVTTDARGNFDITGRFSCTNASEVYLTATGGTPGNSSNNPALTMMTALGSCASLTPGTSIMVNELTTVAGVAALAPYIAAVDAVGSGLSDQKNLVDAFALASEFVNPGTGSTPGLNVPSGTTVPSSLINSIGNILATCVVSDGGSAGDLSTCNDLFDLLTPGIFTANTRTAGTKRSAEDSPAPADTLTAMLALANNPTLNTDLLYSMSKANNFFTPALTVAPNDFAIRLIGDASSLSVSTSSLNFGVQTVGMIAPARLSLSLANSSDTARMYSLVGKDGIEGSNASDFTLTGSTCSGSVASRVPCYFFFTFTPSDVGTRSATFMLHDQSANQNLFVTLTGQGLGTLTITPDTLNFPRQLINTVKKQSIFVKNTGSTPQTLTVTGFTGDRFSRFTDFAFLGSNCGGTILSGATCSFDFSYSPVETAIGDQVTLNVHNVTTGVDVHVPVYGRAFSSPVIYVSPESLNFQDALVGHLSETRGLVHVYSTQSATDFVAEVSGPDAADFFLAFQGGAPVGCISYRAYNDAPCFLFLRFTPSALGVRTANLTLYDQTAKAYVTVPLHGQGVELSTLSFPSTLLFGSLQVGTQSSDTQTLLISNVGSSPQAVTVSGPNAADFSLSYSGCNQAVPGGSGCPIIIAFHPLATGTRTGTITIHNLNANTDTIVTLMGQGTSP